MGRAKLNRRNISPPVWLRSMEGRRKVLALIIREKINMPGINDCIPDRFNR